MKPLSIVPGKLWPVVTVLAFCAMGPKLKAAESQTLWQIGTPDADDIEFALAPADHRQFKEDGVFIVGESDTKRDWPYAQPGPADAWAGNREHTFTILFGL